MTLQETIKLYADCFTTTKRGEETIVIKKDNAPQELRDAIYKAHGERLPDDWIYSKFSEILDTLTGYTINSIDDIEEYRHEIVDGAVDIYTSDLTAWLHSSNYNTYYLDEAVKEFGATENILGVAQYIAIDEIYSEIIELLRDQEEDQEECLHNFNDGICKTCGATED